MQKKKVIEVFKSGHKDFQQLVKSLTADQISNKEVSENWTVKDIISHLSAWNFAQAKEIDNILDGKPTWDKLYKTKKDQDKFNKNAVEERRDKNIKVIISEWEKSFETLINRLDNLTGKEWNSNTHLHSLFHYEKERFSDESRHAQEVKKFFSLYRKTSSRKQTDLPFLL